MIISLPLFSINFTTTSYACLFDNLTFSSSVNSIFVSLRFFNFSSKLFLASSSITPSAEPTGPKQEFNNACLFPSINDESALVRMSK